MTSEHENEFGFSETSPFLFLPPPPGSLLYSELQGIKYMQNKLYDELISKLKYSSESSYLLFSKGAILF